MAETIFVGTQIRLEVDYSSNPEPDPMVLPVVTVTDSASITSTLGSATKKSNGIYYYDWIPSSAGTYVVHFTSTFAIAGSVVTNMPINVIVSSSAPSIKLGEDQFVYFLSAVDPMFIDTEGLASLFPDSNDIEITELIFLYSQEAIDIVGTTIPTSMMREYVMAATACALSRIYDDLGLADQQESQLGDLHISQRRQPKSRNPTRATATSWCELAGLLRLELSAAKTQMKTFVKGAHVIIPMPARQLRHQEWRSWDGD